MKNYYKPYLLLVLISLIFNCQDLTAQLFALKTSSNGNVGLGIDDPMQKLDISGGLKIGTTSTLNAGTIRMKDGCYQGYDGSAWIPLSNSSDCNQSSLTSGSSMDVTIESVPVDHINAKTKALVDQLSALENELLRKSVAQKAAPDAGSLSFDIQVNLSSEGTYPTLHQNTPNPYFDYTLIKVTSVPAISQSSIEISNIHGQKIMTLPVTTINGTAEIKVEWSELQPGLYFYSLIVDGELINSKKMIKAK